MPPSCLVKKFLGSIPVLKLTDEWAHHECDICQEPFFNWVEKSLKLP